MQNTKLCLNANEKFGKPVCELIPLFHRVGFDGFFTAWETEKIGEWAKIAKENVMMYQSVHAPMEHTADLWRDDAEKAETGLAELILCAEDCARYGIPVMVSHAYIGDFNRVGVPTEAGIERYGKLIRRAETLGLKIAFENTEGEEYLAALLETFGCSPAVGFCLDTGHQLCYNRSEDLLALYGHLLSATHLNDNFGSRQPDGGIYWTDDLHLLPFDGIADWDAICAGLDRCGFDGPMTFEIKRESKPDQHENDIYLNMTTEQYVTEAYRRACRVAQKRSCPDKK